MGQNILQRQVHKMHKGFTFLEHSPTPKLPDNTRAKSDPHESLHCLQPLLKLFHELLFLFLFGVVPALILIQF